MAGIGLCEHAGGIRVQSDAWTVEHSRESGGAWSSLKLTHGTGQNLLRRPLSSALRFVHPDASNDLGRFHVFAEHFEKAPRLKIEQSAAGVAVVIAEGTFTDADGKTVPVGYRRRTEYHDHGLIWTTLDFMSDSGCDDAVDVLAFDLELQAMSDVFVRLHPTQAGGGDLLGARGWFDLSNPGVHFVSRFTPLQISLYQGGVQGIDLFTGSEFSAWDTAFKPEAGRGHFAVTSDSSGVSVKLSPYCMAQRRLKTAVRGVLSFRLGMSLPELQQVRAASLSVRRISSALSDEAIAAIARSGAKVLVYENSFAEGGAFWRAGAYPPFDEAGMHALARVIETAHRNNLKVLPSVSLHELHPETAVFGARSREWMHTAGAHLDMIHNYRGSGESGALMCLKSGWVDYCRQSIVTIVRALPWDGIALNHATYYPCCHAGHAAAPWHTDIEQLQYILRAARETLGNEKLMLLNLSDSPSLFAENLADAVFVNAAETGIFPLRAARAVVSP
ncbi:MAG TPA: hypothetical protein VEK08_10245 [Planctomycetota bacterium]|nr:hypothetical protein [Planctomycetota bacterium]